MKKYFYQLTLFVAVLISGQNCQAQILMEKKALIEKNGTDFTPGIDDKGNDYLAYEENAISIVGEEPITKTTIYYIMRYKDSSDVSTHMKVIYPYTEAPYYIFWLDETKLYMGNNKWKDTLTGFAYKAQIIKPFFALTMWLDGEGVTETFEKTRSYSLQSADNSEDKTKKRTHK